MGGDGICPWLGSAELPKLFLKCFWFNKALNKFCQALFPLILNWSEFQGKFNPCASDSFTLNSWRCCVELFDVEAEGGFLQARLAFFPSWKQEVASCQSVNGWEPSGKMLFQAHTLEPGDVAGLGSGVPGAGSGGFQAGAMGPTPPHTPRLPRIWASGAQTAHKESDMTEVT